MPRTNILAVATSALLALGLVWVGLPPAGAHAQEPKSDGQRVVGASVCAKNAGTSTLCRSRFIARNAVYIDVRATVRVACRRGGATRVKLVVGKKSDATVACGGFDRRSDGPVRPVHGVQRLRLEVLGAMIVNPGPKSTRRVPIRLIRSGRRIRSGALTVERTTYAPGFSRRIYSSDFDAYFNICVNRGLRVRAQGGDVYCVYSREPRSTFRVTTKLARTRSST